MKQRLSAKHEQQIAAQYGRPVRSAWTRGGWGHGRTEVWWGDTNGPTRSMVERQTPTMRRQTRRARQLAIMREGLLAMAKQLDVSVCEKCLTPLAIGDYPFCPHGRGANSVEAVTWPGGKVFENLGHEAVRCDSPADLKRELKARGLEPMVRCVPGDQHARSWATMDSYTLEAARVLAERQATSRVSHRDDGPSAETVRIARDVFAGAS